MDRVVVPDAFLQLQHRPGTARHVVRRTDRLVVILLIDASGVRRTYRHYLWVRLVVLGHGGHQRAHALAQHAVRAGTATHTHGIGISGHAASRTRQRIKQQPRWPLSLPSAWMDHIHHRCPIFRSPEGDDGSVGISGEPQRL